VDAIALNKLYEHEVAAGEFISPEQSMRASIARAGKRSFLKSIFFCWPNLEEATRNLARVIGHHFPNASGDGFLLDEAVIAACDAYEVEVSRALRDTAAMTAFLDKLLSVAADGIVQWRMHGVSDGDATSAWPAITMPVFEWLKKRKINKVVFTRRQESVQKDESEATRIILMSSVVTLSDVINLKRDKKD